MQQEKGDNELIRIVIIPAGTTEWAAEVVLDVRIGKGDCVLQSFNKVVFPFGILPPTAPLGH